MAPRRCLLLLVLSLASLASNALGLEASVYTDNGSSLQIEGDEVELRTLSGAVKGSAIFDLLDKFPGLLGRVSDLEEKLENATKYIDMLNTDMAKKDMQVKVLMDTVDSLNSSLTTAHEEIADLQQTAAGDAIAIELFKQNVTKAQSDLADNISDIHDDLDEIQDEVTMLQEDGNLILAAHFEPNSTESAGWLGPVSDPVRVPFIDGTMVYAAKYSETKHNVGEDKCYGDGQYQHITQMISVDPNKTYRVGIWIRSTGIDIQNFFGFQIFDAEKKQITTKPFDNAYFRWAQDGEDWEFNTFRLFSFDTAPGKENPLAGERGSSEYKLPKETAYVTLRFLSCYGDGDGTGESYFALPSMTEEWQDIPHISPVQHRALGIFDVAGADKNYQTQDTSFQKASDFVFFDNSVYQSLVAATEELYVRVCLSYSDRSPTAPNRPEVMLRLQRIVNLAYPNYGSGAGLDGKTYEAGHVFWEESFRHTWSGANLFHHTCGKYIPAAEISCGYTWTNTCQFSIASEDPNQTIKVRGIDIEVAAFPRNVHQE